MGTRRAEATTGFMQYGNTNFANYSFTSLHSVHSLTTLDVINASPPGEALRTFSNGTSINAKVAGLSSPGHAVQAQADGFGHAVLAFKNSEFGNCVLAIHDSPTSSNAAIYGRTKGAGPGVHGYSEGSGQGVLGELADAANTQSVIHGTTEGTGAAIEGTSIRGRGGVFKGKKSQVRLIPSSTTTKPATGSRGDLFVDSTGRLWYCKTGGSTTGWRQLA